MGNIEVEVKKYARASMSANLRQEEWAISCEELLKRLTNSKTMNASKHCPKPRDDWKP